MLFRSILLWVLTVLPLNYIQSVLLFKRNFQRVIYCNFFWAIQVFLIVASAVLPGSLGLMPSASLGSSKYMYEPSGGSAPDLTGLDVANPVAQILCTAMMLRYTFNLPELAAAIETAVSSTLAAGVCTADIAGPGVQPCSTRAFGDAVCAKLSESAPMPA